MPDKTYTKADVDFAVMATDLKTVKDTVANISRKLDAEYVTKDELALRDQKIELLQKIVYGVVGLILTAVVGAVVSLVLTHQ